MPSITTLPYTEESLESSWPWGPSTSYQSAQGPYYNLGPLAFRNSNLVALHLLKWGFIFSLKSSSLSFLSSNLFVLRPGRRRSLVELALLLWVLVRDFLSFVVNYSILFLSMTVSRGRWRIFAAGKDLVAVLLVAWSAVLMEFALACGCFACLLMARCHGRFPLRGFSDRAASGIPVNSLVFYDQLSRVSASLASAPRLPIG